MIILKIPIEVSFDQNISKIIFVKINSMLLFRPNTIHCSTKNAYNSEITFLALVSWLGIETRFILRENIFYILEKLYNQCRVNIIFIKSFYLNDKTEFCEIILALMENFFLIFKIFFCNNKTVHINFHKIFFFNSKTQFYVNI